MYADNINIDVVALMCFEKENRGTLLYTSKLIEGAVHPSNMLEQTGRVHKIMIPGIIYQEYHGHIP